MNRLSGRIVFTLTLALMASAMLSACSSDSPIDSDRDNPFKARDCFDYSDYLHTVSLTETPGWALAVAIENDLVYVADGNSGLQIIDYGDVTAPVLRGAVGTSESALDIAASRGIACLTLGAGGVAVVDVGDPDRPIIVGQLPTPGSAQGVAIVDTVAFVADDVVGLVLVSISRPDAPYTLGVENSPGRAVDVAVSGAFAYVADWNNGFRAVNVNDPSQPWLVNTVALPFGGRGVDVAGDLAFVADGGGGLQIIDVSSPGAEVVVGSLATRGVADDVAVDARGAVAFVAEGRQGVEVVDVSDPSAPSVVNVLATSEDASGLATAGGITVIGETAGGVRVVDVLTSEPPQETARLPETAVGEVGVLASGSGRAFGAGPSIGLFIVEPGESLLQPLGTLALPYEALDLLVVGDSVFVAAETGGVEIIDASVPANLVPAGSLPYQGSVASLDWRSGTLFFAGGRTFATWLPGQGAVNTVDLGSADASAVAVEGDYAYVGRTNNSMQAVNVEIPDRPISVFPLATAGSSQDILAGGGYLFLATAASALPNSSNGVEVYDVRNHLNAVSIAFVHLSTRPYRAALAEDILYVAVGNGGMEVIDVSDPSSPQRVGCVPSRGVSMATTVAGESVFVADGTNGLFTVPVQGCVPSL